jgi:hypothetical protein
MTTITEYCQREHTEALCEALFQLYRLDAIGVLGNNIACWISQDVELVEVRYMCKEPDSSYMHKVADEYGWAVPTMSYEEAVHILTTRLRNTINTL